MLKNILTATLLVSLCACYPVDTQNTFNNEFNFLETKSEPVYLSFRDNKDASFYFFLSKDSNDNYFKIIVRWKNKNKTQLLFDGQRSSLKFLVEQQKIYTYHPSKRTKVVAYNINTGTNEEEGIFEIPEEIFREIAYAKNVSVELRGKNKTVIGYFNKLNTQKAFRNFYENSA